MTHKLRVKTSARSEMADLTGELRRLCRKHAPGGGLCHVFVPHTTCGLAVNENADPDVKRDIIAKLDETIQDDFPYRHGEGNSPAHIKSVLVGPSLTLFVEGGELGLGTWQGVFLCEYDGPRSREVWVKFSYDAPL